MVSSASLGFYHSPPLHLQAAFCKFGWFVRVLFFLRDECYIIAIQDFSSRLMIWTLIWNTCSLARIKEAARCAVLFISIVTNSRYKSLSWKILRVSWNSKLNTRNLKLGTWALKLDSRFLKASRIEDRVSSRDYQLTFDWYCNMAIRMRKVLRERQLIKSSTALLSSYLENLPTPHHCLWNVTYRNSYAVTHCVQ